MKQDSLYSGSIQYTFQFCFNPSHQPLYHSFLPDLIILFISNRITYSWINIYIPNQLSLLPIQQKFSLGFAPSF